MSNPLEALRARKAQLRKELEDMDRDEQELARLTAKYGLKLVDVESPSALPRRQNQPDPESLTTRCRKMAEEVIRETGCPLSAEELRRSAEARGIAITGKQPTSILSAFLSHSDRFEFIAGRGWWLKGLPVPERGAVKPLDTTANGKHLSRKAQVINAVEQYLRRKGSRAKTPELLPVVLALGLDFGPDPGRTISAYLSSSDLFDNGRTSGGYGLVEWSEKTPTPLNGKLPLEAMK